MNIGPLGHNPFFDQPLWFYGVGAACLVAMYFYGWLCSRWAQAELDKHTKNRAPNRLPDGIRPYEWTEQQMDAAETARIDDGAQVDRLFCLQEENRQLKAELHQLRDWPEEIAESPEVYRSVAERKLEEVYKKLRLMNEELAELKLDMEELG